MELSGPVTDAIERAASNATEWVSCGSVRAAASSALERYTSPDAPPPLRMNRLRETTEIFQGCLTGQWYLRDGLEIVKCGSKEAAEAELERRKGCR